MSLSSSYYKNVGSEWRLSISWSATQNTSDNTSTVTAKMYWESLNQYGAISSGTNKTSAIQINDGAWSTESTTAGLSADQKKLINTYTKTINHNSDGTGSFSIDGYFDAEVTLSGTYYGRINLDQKTFTLDTIDRESSLSTSPSWTAGGDFTLSVSRGSPSFSHEAEIYVKTTSGDWNWIKQVKFSTSQTSLSSNFSFAENKEIYTHLDGRSSCASRILLQTFNGSTQIGTKEYIGTVSKASNSTLTSSYNWTAGSDFTVSLSRKSSDFRHEAEIYVKRTDGIFDWVNQVVFSTSQTSLSSAFTSTENQEIFSHLAQRSSADSQIILQTFIDDIYIGANTYVGTVTAPNASTLTTPTSFNIGDSIVVTVNRSDSEFTHTVRLKNGSTVLKEYTGIGTSVTITTSDIKTTLYNASPNSNSLNLTLECVTYSGSYQVKTPTTKTITAKVTNSNPTFATSNISYADTNTTITGITGNPTYIVQNKSTVRVTITAATGINGATITKYEATLNGVANSRTTAGNLDFGVVNAKSNVTLSVKAIDSRGNYTTVTKTVTILPYSPPVANLTTTRKNGWENDTTVKVSGSYSLLTIGGVNKNQLVSFQYRYKPTTSSTWSSWFTDMSYAPVASSYNASKIVNLDNQYAYNVEVKVTDSLGSATTVSKTVPVGLPIFFIDSINKAIGVNDFPLAGEAARIKGKLVVDGEFLLTSSSVKWFDLQLSNGWVNYGGTDPTARCTKTGNIVSLKGIIKDGLVASGTVICILPSGYRPSIACYADVICSGNVVVRLKINPNGNIEILGSGAVNTWLQIEGITFVADGN